MEIIIRSPGRSKMSSSNFLSFILFHLLLFFTADATMQQENGCLEEGSQITDDIGTNSTSLSSPGNVFELGFFTPDGSTNNNRYLGIWYRDNTRVKIVVWVANRGNPILEPNASLIVGGSYAKLINKNNETFWSTFLVPTYSNSSSPSPRSNKTRGLLTNLCLKDNGNLILVPIYEQRFNSSWQSFDHPTDTFLPGMKIHGGISLTSWQDHSTPAPGNFILQLQESILTVVNKTGSVYWDNTDRYENVIPAKLNDLLEVGITVNNLTRLVVDSTGQVQLWEWNNSAGWSLEWFEPKDRCSFGNVCGDFASCNSYNRLLCRCLPGLNPVYPAYRDARDYIGGCSSNSSYCGRKSDHDVFLPLPMMKVGHENYENFTVPDCRAKCHDDCHCIAYSSADASLTGTSTENNCKIWTDTVLTDLQEEYDGGITLYVRTTHSAIALTSRDCDPCGTYSIPYPLSTAANCGDPSYFHFHCNTTTGQVKFSTPSGRFNVTFISQEAETVIIQVGPADSCDSKIVVSMILSNMQSSPFYVRNCTVVSNQPLMDIYQPFIEVEIGWQSPPEPACNSSSECRDWLHTTCKAAKDGKRRCLCASNFDWDGLSLKCNKKVVPVKVKKKVVPVKVLIASVAAALAIVLLVGVIFIYQKTRTARETGSVELMGDNSEPIDLPFFDWESILSATNKFADENKLGTGGFGSVYRGSLLDGQEIAVKRLSSVSVQGAEEFRTEVVLIAKLQHRNLVRLLGYCVKADEKILIYEYMPNGSLDSCLFDETLSVNLDWEKRFDIISGIARGLLYLHQDSRLRIIHRDLKPSNVLLDDDLNPKISDFGIARIVQGKQTESNTKRVVGTYGYMSPEYAYEGIFSVKSDVFSFGVVVLETISGRRNSRIFIYEHGLSLLGHAWKLWSEDRGMELPELTLRKSCNISEVLKCIQIALLCVQEEPNDRPTMSAVVLMLSSENASLPPPKKPAFGTRKPPLETTSSSSAVDMSLNGMSLTVSTVGR